MRVITGSARGRRLKALEGTTTRPTSERVKEALFSAIQFEIEGSRVLDLFAGSGQLGIEALSRGAESCVFVDADRDAAAIIRENLEHVRMSARSRVLNTDAAAYLATCPLTFDLILLDPPYFEGLMDKVLPDAADRLAPGGAMICETDRRTTLPETVGEANLVKTYRHGHTLLWLYRRNAE